MKSPARLLPLLALVVTVPLARAQTLAPPAASSPAHPYSQALRERRLKAIDAAVGLTDAEKASINAIWDRHEQQVYAVMADASLDRRTIRRKVYAIMLASHQEVRAVLTPPQQALFDAMPRPTRFSRTPPADPTGTSPGA
jgi:hypothetical protein